MRQNIGKIVNMMREVIRPIVFGLAVSAMLHALTACTSIKKSRGNSGLDSVTAASESQARSTSPSNASGNEDDLAIAAKPYFDWPVNEARMTRGFFTHPKKKRARPHLGIDLAAPKNTPIFASHAGTVIYVGREFRGYGRVIMIEGRDGYASLYAHLQTASVRPGQEVKQGDEIGRMGNTGRSTGVHLHFEIRRQTGPVDPMQYLPRSASLAARSN